MGVKVLQECIARAGSIEGGLKFYVGAANLEHDDGYGAKVLAEYNRLQNGGHRSLCAPVRTTRNRFPSGPMGRFATSGGNTATRSNPCDHACPA